MTPAFGGWKRGTALFLISQCVSLFGSTIVQMAIVWQATLETSSGTWVAAFSVCAYLPQFLISFAGGVWADRYPRRRLIMGADAVIAASTLLLAMALPRLSGRDAAYAAILAVSVVRSLGAGVQTPAVNAVIPQLVPKGALMRVNGVNAAMQAVVQFAAPAAAGLLLTFSSFRRVLLVDVATAAVGIGLFACVALPSDPPARARAGMHFEMRQGAAYALSHPLLGRLLAVYGLFTFLCVPAGFLAQLLVSQMYGSSYACLTAVELAGFAGMALGGALMGTWGGFASRFKTLRTGLAAFGALAAAMGLVRSFPLYLALMALYGVALTMVQTAATTLVQESAEGAMQGRMFGLMSAMYSGFLPVGMAVFGPLADRVPLQAIMVLSGAALIAMAAAARFDAGNGK